MKSEKKTPSEAGALAAPLSLVQQLAWNDLPHRSAILYRLFKSDWSEEDKATIATALLNLLRQPELPDRAALVLLLAELARDRCDRSALSSAEGTASAQESLRRALLQGLPLYLELVEAPEPQLRLHSLYLSSWLPEGCKQLLPLLLRRLEEEEEPRARAGLAFALAQLAGDQPSVRTRLPALLKAHEAPIVRLGAASALTRLLRAEAPQRAVRLLVRAIASPQAIASDYDALPWARNSVVADSSDLLRLLPRRRLQFSLPVLLEALATANYYEALSLARTLLYVGFSRQPPDSSLQATTPTQQAILTALRLNLSAWQASELLGASASETGARLSAS
ncbi:MAG: hypothetical protein IRZ31_01635 [Thermogemmatispora sp.]|uniref:hypothetical protein n=1 Tax=Thermogemmatispora sp. TaxID=1968838 RepID=UPI002627B15D|nr:hypothetical protein [Thermogemmatispora sp.]MBX5455575.1 hypothetical protein [Thermogemmatispora sp.]